jgi:hypothetical protein
VNFKLKHKNEAKLNIAADVTKFQIAISICAVLLHTVTIILTNSEIFNLIKFIFINFQSLYVIVMKLVFLYFVIMMFILLFLQIWIDHYKKEVWAAVCIYHFVAFFIFVLLINDPFGSLGMHDIAVKRKVNEVINVSALLKIIEYLSIKLDNFIAKIFKTKKKVSQFEDVKKDLLKQRMAWRKFVFLN